MEKKEQIREFFGKHAAAYTVSPGHRRGPDLDLLISLLAPTGAESLLDVACATGNTALALAPLVRQVTGLDITPQMEAEFQAQAQARGVTNATFVLGDVEQMPFPDASFDLVTCRRAAHHFPNIFQAVAEMARVLKPGGKVGVVDMTVPEEPAAARLSNALETARDSSHSRALSPTEWRQALKKAGLRVTHLEVIGEEMPWETWLFPVLAESPDARHAEALALAAPPEVGDAVVRHEADGALIYLKRRVVLVATRP